jgi:hypothetical protein
MLILYLYITGRCGLCRPGTGHAFIKQQHDRISSGSLHPSTFEEPSLLETQSSNQRLDLQVNQYFLKLGELVSRSRTEF